MNHAINFFSLHPQVHEIDMMHATDYTKMNEMDVKANLNYSKCKDKELQNSLKYVQSNIFLNHAGCS